MPKWRNGMRIRFYLFIAILAGFFSSCSNDHSKTKPAPSSSIPHSTTFSTTAWTDYAEYSADSPGSDFYIGAWTHTVEPMGYTTDPNGEGYTGTGNDYPFVIPCSEIVGGFDQLLLMISGNIGFDSGAGSFTYNQNITTATGDYSTIYIYPGQFGGIAGQPDEAAMRGWVYAAWHYHMTTDGTVVNQFAKFGVNAPVIAAPAATINGMGGWPPPADPTPEFVTPKSICVGGDYHSWACLYMQYAKVYVMTEVPTLDEVNSIALRTMPDTTAWADWPLFAGSMEDRSGNSRTLVMKGTALEGIEGPGL
jgi:hypothetical protein